MTTPVSLRRIWLATAAVTMVVVLGLTYRVVRRSDASNASVHHTQQVLSALMAVETAVADLVFGSNDAALDQASTNFVTQIDTLARLTADNRSQQQRLTELRALLPDIVRRRRTTIRDGLVPPSHAIVPERLSQLIRAVRNEELRLLTIRVEDDTRAARRVRLALFAIAVGSGTLLVWVFGLVLRDERYRRDNELALRRANEELDNRVVARTAELNAALAREQGLRREAETANRLKDEFLMTVSHELRTPLNAMLGWADMLRMGVVPAERQQRALESVYKNAQLQKQLIADLLDTARILTGKLRIEATAVDLGQVIRSAVDIVTPAVQAKGLALDVNVDPDLEPFSGDAARLQQVVWNLLANAVKFTEDGVISVDAVLDRAERQVRITVADTGTGISADFLPHVFDRFRQEQTGTARPHGGLGLGLAIARQLIELHGGTITASNRAGVSGAIFTVTLPVRHVQLESSVPMIGAGRDGMPALTGIRALVVDDDPSAREMAAATLQYCGANVATASSAAEARATLTRTNCDVLLIDIAMPGEDGYGLIRDLRGSGVQQPAIALTAQSHDSDRVRALASGFTLHVPKPIEAHALAHAVASLVGRDQRATM